MGLRDLHVEDKSLKIMLALSLRDSVQRDLDKERNAVQDVKVHILPLPFSLPTANDHRVPFGSGLLAHLHYPTSKIKTEITHIRLLNCTDLQTKAKTK